MAVTDVVVVDANVAAKWLLREHDSDTATALANQWRLDSVRVTAPHTLLGETSNTLHQRVRRDGLAVDTATALLNRLRSTGIEFLHAYALYPRAIELAGQLEQGAVYDSIYLALAESLDCELWTADERFQRPAQGEYPRVRLLAEFSPLA